MVDDASVENQEKLLKLYRKIANGDEEAFKFLIAWGHYVHNIDDQVDKDKSNMQSAEDICGNYYNAFALYNSNFWCNHRALLYPLVPIITCDYVLSNNKALKVSDHLRSTGNMMLKMVAFITGDWVLLREVSVELDTLSDEQQRSITIK